MINLSKYLEFNYKYREENNLTYNEMAELTESIAEHYRWYGEKMYNKNKLSKKEE